MISIRMSLEEWQQVLNLLAQHPFHAVAPLIGQIQNQAQQGMAAQQNMLSHKRSGNGLDLASGEDADRLTVENVGNLARGNTPLDS